MKESTLKKLKKEYTPEMISFRRKWVNLFRENKIMQSFDYNDYNMKLLTKFKVNKVLTKFD